MKENPYVGPRPYERRDRLNFYGRNRESRELHSLILAERVVLFYAQSGAGKTSLLNAQVIPALEQEGFNVLPVARVGIDLPPGSDTRQVDNVFVSSVLMALAGQERLAETLLHHTLRSFLEAFCPQQEDDFEYRPPLLILDQFEELFTTHRDRWQEAKGFFLQLREALDALPNLGVVFTMREDHVAKLDPYAPLLPHRLRARFRMERLSKGAALAAVKGPLKDTSRSFAQGVAEQLVEELLKERVATAPGETTEIGGEFVEPVQLQVVCQSLWRDLPPDVTVITLDHLQTFGDVNQALLEFYERSIKRAIRETGVREANLRSCFEDRLITPAGTRGTVYRGREKSGEIPNEAVDVLENLHLIRGEWRAGARWYELTHDRFIEPIQGSNKTWQEKRRRTLLTALGAAAAALVLILGLVFGTQLVAMVKKEAAQAIATVEKEAAQAVATVEKEATQAVAEVEKDATQAVAEVEKDATQAVAAVEKEATQGAQQAAVTAVAAATVEKEAQQAMATATAAAAESSDLWLSVARTRSRPLKPGLSVSGEVAGSGTIGAFVRDAKGEFYLLGATFIFGPPDYELGSPVIQPGRPDGGQAPDDVVGYFARYLPLAEGVSVANLVGLARLKEGVTFETAIPGIGPVRGVREPAVGTSVRALGRATGLATGKILKVGQAFEMASPRPADKGAPILFVNGIATSPLGMGGEGGALVVDDEGYAIGVIVAASPSETILAPIQEILDGLEVQLVLPGQELLALSGHQGGVLSATWSPDGARVVTAGQDGTARLWDTQTGRELAPLSGHKDRVNAVTFSPDGQLVVTASQDGTARLWALDTRATTGKALAVLQHNGGVLSAAFSPDGRLLVTGSHDDTARVWDADTGKVVAVLQHKGSVWSAVFSPDGQWIVTASWDDTARLWEATTGKEWAVLRGHTAAVRSAVFSPAGKWVVTASQDGTARLWDVSTVTALSGVKGLNTDAVTGKELTILRHEGSVWSATFSPDGRLVVTASQDGTARLWQTSTGERVAVMGHKGEVLSAAFSPDGAYLVTASADGTARLWDASTGEGLFTLRGHTAEVFSAAWSPDGVRVVTAGGDGKARIWQGR